SDDIFYNSKHPYTWGLLGSMPKLDNEDEELKSIPGSPPDLKDPPKGCPFAARCPYAMKVCNEIMPDFKKNSETHETACWLLDERAPKVDPPENVLAKGVEQGD